MRASWRESAAAFGVALLAVIVVTWPLATSLGARTIEGPFMGNLLWDLRAFSDTVYSGGSIWETRLAGWPLSRGSRYLGLPSLLAMLALKPLGPLVVGNLLVLLATPLTALTMERLLRRWVPDARPWMRALAGVTYALSPHMLANLSNGELAKAQFWVAPLTLLCLERMSKDWRWTPAVMGAALLAAFASPYNAMTTAAVAFGALLVFGRGTPERREWAPRAVGVALVGGALLLAAAYYSQPLGSYEYLYGPAQRRSMVVMDRAYTQPVPVLMLKGLVWPDPTRSPGGVQHGIYLTWTALSLAGVGMARKGAERWLALGLAAVGIMLGLGPRLVVSEAVQTALPLPMWLAERFDLPIARSGQYYRFVQISLVGLAVGVARARVPRWAPPLALGVFGAEVALNQASGVPLPTVSMEYDALLAAMDDDVEGAVLHLPDHPRGVTTVEYGFRVAALHGRPVWNVPRGNRGPYEGPPCGKALDLCLTESEVPCAVPEDWGAKLKRWGVHFVLLHPDEGYDTTALQSTLSEALGAPQSLDGLLLYTIAQPVPPARVPDDKPPVCNYQPPGMPGMTPRPGPPGPRGKAPRGKAPGAR